MCEGNAHIYLKASCYYALPFKIPALYCYTRMITSNWWLHSDVLFSEQMTPPSRHLVHHTVLDQRIEPHLK